MSIRKAAEYLTLIFNSGFPLFLMIILPFLDYFYIGLNKYETVFIAVIALSCVNILLINSSKKYKINYIDILTLLFFSYGLFSSIFISINTPEPMLYFKWIAIINLYLMIRLSRHKVIHTIILGIYLSIILQSIIGILQYFNYIHSLNPNFKVTGSFNNPGPFGIFLSIGLVTVLWYIYEKWKSFKKGYRLLFSLCTVIIMAGIILSGSRTAFLSLMITLIYFIHIKKFYLIKSSGILKKRFRILSILFVALSLMGLYLYRPLSANARLLIWRVSLQMATENLLTGHGVQSFSSLYMPTQADFFEKNPDSIFKNVSNNHFQSFNEYIHLLCEQGIVGLSIFILIIFFSVKYSNIYFIKAGLLSLLVCSAFIYIADIFSILCLFPIFIGLLGSSIKPVTIIEIKRLLKITLISLFVCTSSIAILFNNKYNVAETFLRHLLLHNEQRPVDESCSNILIKNHTFSLFYAKQLTFYENKDLAIQTIEKISKHISTSDMMSDLGQLCKQAGYVKKAEEYFIVSSLMNPQKLTPLYFLFLLYEENGDNSKAIETAIRIMNYESRFYGSVAIRIKNEIREYLKTHLPK